MTLTARQRRDNTKRYLRKDARTAIYRAAYGMVIKTFSKRTARLHNLENGHVEREAPNHDRSACDEQANALIKNARASMLSLADLDRAAKTINQRAKGEIVSKELLTKLLAA